MAVNGILLSNNIKLQEQIQNAINISKNYTDEAIRETINSKY